MFFGGDPFEHFAHAGMGGGRGGGRSAASRNVDTTKLYETLGVSIHPLTHTFKSLWMMANLFLIL